MRRVIIVLILIFLFLTISGCGAVGSTGGESSFIATILEIDGNRVTAEPVEGEDILSSADKIIFSSESLDDIGVSEGDKVSILYIGEVMETYPAQINAVSWSVYEET